MNVFFYILLLLYVIIELFIVINRYSNLFLVVFFYFIFTCVHFGISIISFIFLNKTDLSIDSVRFYNNALSSKTWFSLFDLGSDFISFIIYPFVKIGLNIEVLFLVFATVSFKAFLLIFNSINLTRLNKKNIWVLFFFTMPSVHYWTGCLGKESLLILLLSLLFVKIRSRAFNLHFLFIYMFMFLIRPHLAIVLLLALFTFFLIDRNLEKKIKLKVCFFIVIFLLTAIPISIYFFLKVGELSLININLYIVDFLNVTKVKTNSGIDLLNTTFFERVLYLLFMPLPYLYEVKNKVQLLASIENLFFISMLFYYCISWFRKNIKIHSLKYEDKYVLISIIFMIILFSSYLYNLGIGNRMRSVFFPYLFYLFASLFVYEETMDK